MDEYEAHLTAITTAAEKRERGAYWQAAAGIAITVLCLALQVPQLAVLGAALVVVGFVRAGRARRDADGYKALTLKHRASA